MDIEQLVASGSIKNELEYERAMIAFRKLRILAKTDTKLKALRIKLRDLLAEYEDRVWGDEDQIGVELIDNSDKAEQIAENERQFFEHRKEVIYNRLKEYGLTQKDLRLLLGHRSKSHMSELINGIKPFKLQDLVIISKLFRLDIDVLVPKYLPIKRIDEISATIEQINKPKLNEVKLELVTT